MPTLHVSCLGILLKHHLFHHHSDVIALKGRVQPEIAHAFASFPPDFQISNISPPPPPAAARCEQRLTLHLHLSRANLSVEGILARGGVDESRRLMPLSLWFRAAPESGVTPAVILDSLTELREGSPTFVLEIASYISRYQPVPAPTGKRRRASPSVAKPFWAKVA